MKYTIVGYDARRVVAGEKMQVIDAPAVRFKIDDANYFDVRMNKNGELVVSCDSDTGKTSLVPRWDATNLIRLARADNHNPLQP